MGSHFAHRRTRFLLLMGILIVSGLTVSSYLMRQRKRGRPRPLPSKIAADVDQQTQAFVLSKSSGGQALYTVQASQVTNFKDTGKTLLRHVSIQMFGKKGDRRDHITTQECEFDKAKSSFFLPGEVDIDMEATPADPSEPAKQGPSNPVHIVTSGLTFDQNTGIASTENEVRFRFAGGEGISQGATYNPQDQTITLKAQAQFTLWRSPEDQKDSSSTVRQRTASGQAPLDEQKVTHVRAASLRFQRGQRQILLTAPVELAQGTRWLQAGDSEIFLDEQQRAQRASLGGGVHGVDRDPLSPSEARASRSEIEFTPQGKARKVLLEGGTASPVTWASASAQSRKEGQSQRAEMYFQEPDGLLSRVHAEGQVRVSLSPFSAPGKLPLLPDKPQEPVLTAGSRVILAQQADLFLAPDGETLREVRTRSSSTLQLFPAKAGEDKRTVQGENFVMGFDSAGELSQFSAEENVKFVAEGTDKTGKARSRASTSDHLSADFDTRTHSVSRMRQWGHFHYQDPDRQARADRADYTAEGDVVVLQGEPLSWNPTGKLTAHTMSLANSTGEITAAGNVATTDYPTASPGSPPPEAIHVVADHLQYNSKTGKAQYQGNARLWQGSDLIEADWLELDRQQQQLLARKGVYSVFPGRPEAQKQKTNSPASHGTSPQNSSGPFAIRSDNLVYKQEEHKALYQGKVRMQSPTSTLTSEELEILFKPPAAETRTVPDSGSWQIERAVAVGNVVINEPTRTSTGNRAEYFPQENKIILIGNLATVVDSQKGTTEGARLTYFTADDKIFVQGEPGSPAETRRPMKR